MNVVRTMVLFLETLKCAIMMRMPLLLFERSLLTYPHFQLKITLEDYLLVMI